MISARNILVPVNQRSDRNPRWQLFSPANVAARGREQSGCSIDRLNEILKRLVTRPWVSRLFLRHRVCRIVRAELQTRVGRGAPLDHIPAPILYSSPLEVPCPSR